MAGVDWPKRGQAGQKCFKGGLDNKGTIKF